MKTLCLILTLLAPAIAGEAKGHLLLIGGGQKPASVMAHFVELAGGSEALILVVPTASELADTGDYYQKLLGEHGARNVVPLKLTKRKHARDEQTLDLMEKARGIFFSGGDQRRITKVIKDTPFHEALRKAYARGAVIGGTSAGTACMSSLMITGDGQFDRITAQNVELWKGLGLFPGVILDQHFVARQRQNRLIATILEHPKYLGVGVEEATALWLKPDRSFTVMGEGQVLIYDVSSGHVASQKDGEGETRLGVTGMQVHVLLPGDSYDLTTRTPRPARR